MGEMAKLALKMAVKFAFITGALLSFIAVFLMMVSMIGVTLNIGILSDLFTIVQIWLPFNLGIMLAWVVAGVVVYFTYRLSIIALNYIRVLTEG